MKYIMVCLLLAVSWTMAEKAITPVQVVSENSAGIDVSNAQPSSQLMTPEIADLQKKMDDAMARGDFNLARQYDRQIVDLRYGTTVPSQPTGLPIPHSEKITSSTSGPSDWGTDRLIYTGSFRTYACDYDTNGTMYVAVSCPDSTAKVYRSLDHGLTWTLMGTYSHSPKDYYTKLGLVATQGDSGFIHLFMRHSVNNGDIYEFRIKKDFSGWNHYYVATGVDTIDDFSVCEDYWNPAYYLYLLYASEHSISANAHFVRSINYGRTFIDTTNFSNMWQPSISFGSNNVIHVAVRLPPQSAGTFPYYRIFYKRNTSFGGSGSWRSDVPLCADTFDAWDPCVAATNTRPDTAATVWVLFTHDYYNTGDQDLEYAYSTDGGATFTTGAHLEYTSNDAYFANARQYRIYGTSGYPYIAACYTLTTSTTTNVYWTWAAQSTPTTWYSPHIQVNDAQASTSLGGLATWSPHSTSLGGAYYPRFGPVNLYFDAPYVTGSVQEPSTTPSYLDIQITPNPFTNNISISYQINQASDVSAIIYDAAGREVKTITNGHLEKGYYRVSWNGLDNNNRAVNNGIYFFRLTTDNENVTRKLILTK